MPRRIPPHLKQRPGPKRTPVPEPLLTELQDFRKAADRAVQRWERLAPKVRRAVADGLPALAVARELGWTRQRMYAWLRGKSGGV